MNKEVIDELLGSIEKWRKIAYEDGVDNGGKNCPLCQLFIYKYRTGCGGCPVCVKTGLTECHGTPYIQWDAMFDEMPYCVPARISELPEEDQDKAKQCAIEEMNFLISLLSDYDDADSPSIGAIEP